jgi:2-haloacid dehalogenase
MAVMNSLAVWAAAAGDPARGIEWRDAATARMIASEAYVPYEWLVGDAARAVGLDPDATARLLAGWPLMEPWPDAQSVARLRVPYAFLTNCSATLAGVAASRSGLHPRFMLSAEEAGGFKPRPEVYELACDRLGTTPTRTLVVAGSPYDAAGARYAGLHSVLVVRRPDHRTPGSEIPTVDALSEIPRLLGRGTTKS